MSKLRQIAFIVFAIVALSSCTKSAWMGDTNESVTLRTATSNSGVVSDDNNNSGSITDDEDDNGNTKKKSNK